MTITFCYGNAQRRQLIGRRGLESTIAHSGSRVLAWAALGATTATARTTHGKIAQHGPTMRRVFLMVHD